MKLESFLIKNFRRIKESHFRFGDATFLIGENNVGKSSVLKALEIFFSEGKLHDEDYFKTANGHEETQVVFEAKFTDLPNECYQWRGFNGRIHKENINGNETLCIYYRKTYNKGGSSTREMKSFKLQMKAEFAKCKTINDFVNAGINAESLNAVFGADYDADKTIPAKDKDRLEDVPGIFDVDETDSSWSPNPGGIEGNISIRLPKFLLIPAESRKEDIDGSNGVLQKTMKELFEEVRDLSENFKKAHEFLGLLAKEMDPGDGGSEFGKMLAEINSVVKGVFHQSQLHVAANLSDPSAVIKPSFDIEMSSNVRTRLERQGMGSVRSAAFALLRYRENYLQQKGAQGELVRKHSVLDRSV